MASIPVVGDIEGTAKLQFVLKPKPVQYVSSQGQADSRGFGPAVEITLSKNAQAALKAKQATTNTFGDNR